MERLRRCYGKSRGCCAAVNVVGVCLGRMDMFRESSEALLHTVSERGTQLQGE